MLPGERDMTFADFSDPDPERDRSCPGITVMTWPLWTSLIDQTGPGGPETMRRRFGSPSVSFSVSDMQPYPSNDVAVLKTGLRPGQYDQPEIIHLEYASNA